MQQKAGEIRQKGTRRSLLALHELERSDRLAKLFSVVYILNSDIKGVLHQPVVRKKKSCLTRRGEQI